MFRYRRTVYDLSKPAQKRAYLRYRSTLRAAGLDHVAAHFGSDGEQHVEVEVDLLSSRTYRGPEHPNVLHTYDDNARYLVLR